MQRRRTNAVPGWFYKELFPPGCAQHLLELGAVMGAISRQTGGALLGVGVANATPGHARRRRRGRRHGAATLFGAAGLLLTVLSVLAVYLG